MYKRQGEPLLQAPVPGDAAWTMASAALAMQNGGSWRANSVAAYSFALQCGDTVRAVRVLPDRHGAVAVTLDGATTVARVLQWTDGMLRLELDGVTQTAIAVFAGDVLHLSCQGHSHTFAEVAAFPNTDALKDARRVLSPVAGKLVQVLAASGDAVQEGQRLACVEAMKMEMWLCADSAGTVKAVHAVAGEQVEAGALLVELDIKKDA